MSTIYFSQEYPKLFWKLSNLSQKISVYDSKMVYKVKRSVYHITGNFNILSQDTSGTTQIQKNQDFHRSNSTIRSHK
ncbi:hypothetical protein YC2023_009885 [Brassica napus]